MISNRFISLIHITIELAETKQESKCITDLHCRIKNKIDGKYTDKLSKLENERQWSTDTRNTPWQTATASKFRASCIGYQRYIFPLHNEIPCQIWPPNLTLLPILITH